MKDEAKVGELRQATREANETLKDFKHALRDGEDLLKRMAEVKEDLILVSNSVFNDRMSDEVEAGLEDYRASLDRQIEAATQAVYERFDTLGRILLGKEDDKDRALVGIIVDRVENGPLIERPK